LAVPKSVLEAIKVGEWDYEPEELRSEFFQRTDALPGSPEKLDILADRLSQGLPLWHPSDRLNCVGLYGPDEEDE
jgi:hypothetical protein